MTRPLPQRFSALCRLLAGKKNGICEAVQSKLFFHAFRCSQQRIRLADLPDILRRKMIVMIVRDENDINSISQKCIAPACGYKI